MRQAWDKRMETSLPVLRCCRPIAFFRLPTTTAGCHPNDALYVCRSITFRIVRFWAGWGWQKSTNPRPLIRIKQERALRSYDHGTHALLGPTRTPFGPSRPPARSCPLPLWRRRPRRSSRGNTSISSWSVPTSPRRASCCSTPRCTSTRVFSIM